FIGSYLNLIRNAWAGASSLMPTATSDLSPMSDVQVPCRVPSMSAEHKCLEGQHEGLQPQDQRVHQAQGINSMKRDRPKGACVLWYDDVVIVGIGIGDATAAWCHTVKTTLEERLEEDQKRAGS